MTKDRMNGMLLGILYIVAAATSILAVALFQPILSEQWYMAAVDGRQTKILIASLNEFLLIVSVVGTAIMLFPYVRRWNEHIALGYFCFRFMEAVFISVGLVCIFGLLQLSLFYEAGSIVNDEHLSSIGFALQAVYQWTAMLGPNLMLGLNTIMYSYLLFKTGLVPKPLALFGIITAISVFTAGLLELFSVIEPWSAAKGLIALPVGVYEMSLAIWLIVKGFHVKNLEKLKQI